MDLFPYMLMIFEPLIFSLVLAAVIVVLAIFYIQHYAYAKDWSMTALSIWQASSIVLGVSSPAFYWVYGIGVGEHLLILIACYLPFHIETRQILHKQLIDNQVIIGRKIEQLISQSEQQKDKLNMIEESLERLDPK